MAKPRASAAIKQAAPEPALLLDTYSLVFRAFHALPEMTTRSGEPTSALYGFSALLLKLLKEQRPRALAFALDAPQRTFRHEAYAEYKGTRERAPSPLVAQLSRLPTLLRALSVPAVCVPGFEADDVLATLARRLGSDGIPVLIVSGDRDLLQLVDERTSVWFVGGRGQEAILFDEAKVKERFLVTPGEMPLRAALVGDASDNLQGVPGVGASTAAKLVRAFGTAEALLARVDEVEPERVRNALREHSARLILNERLTRLDCNVPLPEGPFASALTEAGCRALSAVFEELEFRSLLPRLEAIRQKLVAPPGA
jgi:DNA polymerase-1